MQNTDLEGGAPATPGERAIAESMHYDQKVQGINPRECQPPASRELRPPIVGI